MTVLEVKEWLRTSQVWEGLKLKQREVHASLLCTIVKFEMLRTLLTNLPFLGGGGGRITQK